MRPQRQSGQTPPRTKAASSGLNVFEICAQLADSSADPAALLETIAASACQVFQASAARMLVKDGETFVLKACSTEEMEKTGTAEGGCATRVILTPGLLSQAQPFADEA